MNDRSSWTPNLRALEVLYRQQGRFESAVQMQMVADCIESDPSAPRIPMCSWFQRGFTREQKVFEVDGLLGIPLLNGMVHYLTLDVVFDLWITLTVYLGLTGADLRCAARLLDDQQRAADYDEKPFTPDMKESP
jgi:hypothetical protein